MYRNSKETEPTKLLWLTGSKFTSPQALKVAFAEYNRQNPNAQDEYVISSTTSGGFFNKFGANNNKILSIQATRGFASFLMDKDSNVSY